MGGVRVAREDRMRTQGKRWLVALVAVLACVGGVFGQSGVLIQPEIEGVVSLVWGDPQQGREGPEGPLVTLDTDSGQRYRLALSDDQIAAVGGLVRLNRQRVAVSSNPGGIIDAPLPAILATGIRILGNAPEAVAAVTGSQPWVSVACKFSGNATEPKTLSYFVNMYGGTSPELEHYWRELSYDFVSVEGSTAVGWYTLPKTHAQYMISPAPPAGTYPRIDLNALFADCTALADPVVNFASYQGINLMFNDNLDDAGCCSWGGSRYTTLDGVTRTWRVTWEAQWGFSNVAVVQHEMGHGFGWPHSSSSGCFSSFPYNNHWDVMSDSWLCNPSDTTYGCFAQHSITYNLDLAGWVPAFKKVTVASGEAKTVKLERLARPWSLNPLEVQAIISSGHSLTYEARTHMSYDNQLAGEAVIIHDIVPSRSDACTSTPTNTSPANVIDLTLDGNTSDAGAQFVVGESYDQNNVHMHVDAALPTGFQISVANNVAAHSATALRVTGGDGNAIWEPSEQVTVQPTWLNFGTSAINGITGTLATSGAVAINTSSATYGDFAANTSAACSSCYVATATGPRPGTHWDVTLNETLSNGRTKAWSVHVGSSFADVPLSQPFYNFIETLLHSGITLGCTTTTYCPSLAVPRSDMAIFLARAIAGGDANVPVTGYVSGKGSYNCAAGGTSRFADVAPTLGSCRHIHYIAARGVTLGCTATTYCPDLVVARGDMAMFVARAIANRDELVPLTYTDATTGRVYSCDSASPNLYFTADITTSTLYCRHAHFLWARGVVSGISANTYGGVSPVIRDQMAKFLVNGFGLQLYGP
jgi:M6 family metalloprotease-like protein